MQIATTAADMDAMNLQLHKQARYPFYGKFTTTGATCKVLVPDNFRRFRLAGTPCFGATPATDELMYIDSSVHTVGADGVYPAAGSQGAYYIQFARTAGSPTSGLDFTGEVIGLP